MGKKRWSGSLQAGVSGGKEINGVGKKRWSGSLQAGVTDGKEKREQEIPMSIGSGELHPVENSGCHITRAAVEWMDKAL